MIAHSVDRAVDRVARGAALFPDEVLEYYRPLLAALAGLTPAPRKLGLTSAAHGEGVTTVTAQLACAAACCGMGRVLLVDANLARPALDKLLGLPDGPGLAEVLLEGVTPAEVVQQTSVANLAVLMAGQAAGRPFDHEAMTQVIERLQSDFDLIVLDLPACTAGPSTARLAAGLDGVLLVVEAESSRADLVGREKDLLAAAGVRLLGAVLNKRRRYIPTWLQRYL
jgi:capsular exopolysaccharide synthesis family protein